jgi:hypothetical protein
VSDQRAPQLVKAIPRLRVNQGMPIQAVDLKDYIQNPEGVSEPIRFQLHVFGKDTLPEGLYCRNGVLEGVVGGTAAEQAAVELEIIADNGSGQKLTAYLSIRIYAAESVGEEAQAAPFAEDVNEAKAEVWKAVIDGDELPANIADLFNQAVSAQDVYYLLGRISHFVIWNAGDLSAPGEKKLLSLAGVSERFDVYDRGSCLVAVPKDLFDGNRSFRDALDTAQAMTREVYQREWTIEFAGYDKMVAGAWVEAKRLEQVYGREMKIDNYAPTVQEEIVAIKTLGLN